MMQLGIASVTATWKRVRIPVHVLCVMAYRVEAGADEVKCHVVERDGISERNDRTTGAVTMQPMFYSRDIVCKAEEYEGVAATSDP